MHLFLELKKYYNCFFVVLLVAGLLLIFNNTVKAKTSIQTFEITNNIISGKINRNGYLGVLEIPKINLMQGFYEYSSPLNTVDKNIEVIETSQMPDIKNSNLILAAHSGSSKLGYFKHLDEINISDEVIVDYNGKDYYYIINDIYDAKKTGYIDIYRNKEKTTITLITCKKNTNLQTVYIGYLQKVL